jgi:hypothetical protein
MIRVFRVSSLFLIMLVITSYCGFNILINSTTLSIKIGVGGQVPPSPSPRNYATDYKGDIYY